MRLIEQDWNAPGGVRAVEFQYPDAPIAAFMNWLRTTKAWMENPELVERRLRRLNMELLDLRNSGAAKPYVPKAQAPVRVAAGVTLTAPGQG